MAQTAPGLTLDEPAAAQLYRDHHRWLLQWLWRRTGCPHTAEDLSHDTFLRAWSRPRSDVVRRPQALLRAIAHGVVVDHLRRRDLERAYLEALAQLPPQETPSPEVNASVFETLLAIDRLLRGLPARARSAFLLARLEGLSYPQVAERLGVSLSTVEKYMARALRHCYDALARE